MSNKKIKRVPTRATNSPFKCEQQRDENETTVNETLNVENLKCSKQNEIQFEKWELKLKTQLNNGLLKMTLTY